MNKNALIIFAKPPVAGLAKTRLIPALGKEGAADYHAKLLRHTLANVVCLKSRNANTNENKKDTWDSHLWCSENIAHPFFIDSQKKYALKLHEQRTGDLGDRMFHAMSVMLTEYDKVCIIGSDCPVIDSTKIMKVFDDLTNQTDVVITPAEDGGYVLMAVKNKISMAIFSGVQWGGASVFQQTLSNLQKLSLNPVIQQTLWDIDEPQDMARIAL